jgi:hypothetical protein
MTGRDIVAFVMLLAVSAFMGLVLAYMALTYYTNT